MRAGEGCAAFERAFPVTVARAPFLPIESLQRPRSSALPACSDLQLFRVVQLDNCTAYVHQRRGKRGHFVIEPLLCPTPSFQLLRDFSLGSHYVRLPALIEDESVIAAVRSRIGSASVESLEFMKLWHASIHVSSRLSQWRFEALRLSVDRRTAELRAYCRALESCDLLISILQSEPVNFWKGIRWSGSFSLKDECEYRTSQSRFAFRMKDRMSVNSQAVRAALSNLEALSNKTVTRDDRSFLVVVQRNCRTSQFQRYWREYVAGFGDDINFWIGLDTMHRLTSSRSAALRVEILLWNNTEWFAEYSNFVVGPASTSYTMSYGSMVRAKSSLVFDALQLSRGQKFSTRDVDNDGYSASHCSVNWGGYGGWWHKYSSCSYANPNGNYYYGQTTTASYAVWYFVEGFRALKEFRMMIQV
ncbi:hypothetical protein BOX15_Mlig007778g2 [Macrostomum lignano]|uniref:Fibrinogen C-terminal domain-containing protein n=1 Tax=Macrostomum lignano TaxID=282301 RepID=A0A267EJ35_9PLAT|nr:hypothetical protein BOX15_Mlig007778g2 [Macrostomum lignano]